MKEISRSCCLAAFVCGVAGGCAAQGTNRGATPKCTARQHSIANQPIKSTMTCEEVKGLLKAGDKQTIGLAVLWLDGYYSGRAGLSELPAGWTRTVGQGLGGTCAISVNAHHTVLDVIGQLHREYAGRN
jgi:hypothetical protein